MIHKDYFSMCNTDISFPLHLSSGYSSIRYCFPGCIPAARFFRLTLNRFHPLSYLSFRPYSSMSLLSRQAFLAEFFSFYVLHKMNNSALCNITKSGITAGILPKQAGIVRCLPGLHTIAFFIGNDTILRLCYNALYAILRADMRFWRLGKG